MIDCETPLGMENGAISDVQITSSSQWSNKHAAQNARLNFKKQGAWGWVTPTNNYEQWLQVDLGSNKTVTGVATQGSPDNLYDNWVTKYRLQCSDDGVTFRIYKATNDTFPKVYQCIILAFCS